jgi:hypothetical protein
VALQIQAILQTQRQRLLLRELAAKAAPNLIAKLCNAFADRGTVMIAVLIHALMASGHS